MIQYPYFDKLSEKLRWPRPSICGSDRTATTSCLSTTLMSSCSGHWKEEPTFFKNLIDIVSSASISSMTWPTKWRDDFLLRNCAMTQFPNLSRLCESEHLISSSGSSVLLNFICTPSSSDVIEYLMMFNPTVRTQCTLNQKKIIISGHNKTLYSMQRFHIWTCHMQYWNERAL